MHSSLCKQFYSASFKKSLSIVAITAFNRHRLTRTSIAASAGNLIFKLLIQIPFTVSNVVVLPSSAERLPARSPYLHDSTWLVSLCANDIQMVSLMSHLHRVHNVVSVADFDAAGWNIVNTYRGDVPRQKLTAFLRQLGKKRPDLGRFPFNESARILPFNASQP